MSKLFMPYQTFYIGDIVCPIPSTNDGAYNEVYASLSCEVIGVDRDLLTVQISNGLTFKCFAYRFSKLPQNINIFNDQDFLL